MTKDNQDALRCADGVEHMDTFTDYQRAELFKSADHLRRLVRENEAQAALLHRAFTAVEAAALDESQDARERRQQIATAIRQHLGGRA